MEEVMSELVTLVRTEEFCQGNSLSQHSLKMELGSRECCLCTLGNRMQLKG